jgi:hypothetical protein
VAVSVAIAAIATVPADTDPLANTPSGNSGTDRVDQTDDFMTRHPRILDAGKRPFLVSLSLWQTPQAWTLILTVPAWGSEISRSTNSKGPFGRGTWTTRILAIPKLRQMIALIRNGNAETAGAAARCYAALVSSRAERRASTSFCAERPKKW